MAGTSEFIDALLKDSKSFAKEELKTLIRQAKADDRIFIRHIGELSEEFIQLRALNQITNSEFEELMRNLLDLKSLQYEKLSISAKARAQRLVNGLSEIILNNLLKII